MSELEVLVIASHLHEAQERLAPSFGFESRAPLFRYLPKANRDLMMATVRSLLTDNIIEPGRRVR